MCPRRLSDSALPFVHARFVTVGDGRWHGARRAVTIVLMSPWEDRIVARLHDVLRTTPPPRAPVGVLGPVAALAELERWLADDHQWRAAQWRDWSSLIVDVCDAFDALPHRARSAMAAAGSAPWLAALVTQRRRLERDGKDAIGAALRTDLAGALAGLRAALETHHVLAGIWDDLVRAVRVGAYEREEATAALLGEVVAARGSAWEPLADRIRGVLADIGLDVEAARAEISSAPRPAPRVTSEAAGASAKERLALARALLAVPVEGGRRVVWLAFPHGRVDQFVLPVGESVTLFDGSWLASVLQHWDESAHAHDKVPKEVVEHRDEVLSSWRRSEDLDRFAAVRVDLGSGNIANALDRAKDSADALLRLTALHTGTQPPWRPGPFIMFVDGRLHSRTIGLDEVHAARHRPRGPDHVSACVATLADLVGPHLPVTAREVHEALELLRWLDEARETWDPARLALCDRVVEQAAGWAGKPDGQRFALAHLAAPWAWSQVMGEIDAAGRAAVYAIDGGPFTASAPDRRAAFLEALGTRGY